MKNAAIIYLDNANKWEIISSILALKEFQKQNGITDLILSIETDDIAKTLRTLFVKTNVKLDIHAKSKVPEARTLNSIKYSLTLMIEDEYEDVTMINSQFLIGSTILFNDKSIKPLQIIGERELNNSKVGEEFVSKILSKLKIEMISSFPDSSIPSFKLFRNNDTDWKRIEKKYEKIYKIIIEDKLINFKKENDAKYFGWIITVLLAENNVRNIVNAIDFAKDVVVIEGQNSKFLDDFFKKPTRKNTYFRKKDILIEEYIVANDKENVNKIDAAFNNVNKRNKFVDQIIFMLDEYIGLYRQYVPSSMPEFQEYIIYAASFKTKLLNLKNPPKKAKKEKLTSKSII